MFIFSYFIIFFMHKSFYRTKIGSAVAEIIKKSMETAVELDVPLTVEVGAGDNWMNVK